MFTGALNGLGMSLLNILKIPPGVTRRAANSESSGGWRNGNLANNDFVNTVVDITADDVCIGNSPVFLAGEYDSTLSPILDAKLRGLVQALNRIARWAAVDILKHGVSVYKFKAVDVKSGGSETISPRLIPFKREMYFYMSADGDVKGFTRDGKELDDCLVFLSYSKETLLPLHSPDGGSVQSDNPAGVDLDAFEFQIVPEPIQLNHISTAANDLYRTERAIFRYRTQLSRLVRLVTVDVGNSSGDRTQEVIDDINASINANSMSLMSTMDQLSDFDDNLPVHPHRKGIGKPEVYEDFPDFDIDKLADLDYALSQFFLAARFPKSYADFSSPLSDTAVSLIRGDIRYSRMVDRARSLLEDSMNEWIKSSADSLASKEGSFVKLVTLPNSEDDDVVEALSKFTDFTTGFFEFVNGSGTLLEAATKLRMLKTLLGNTANLHAIQNWFSEMDEYFSKKFATESAKASRKVDAPSDAFDLGGSEPDTATPSEVDATSSAFVLSEGAPPVIEE